MTDAKTASDCLQFYGGSDNLIEVEGWFAEEYNTTRASFLVGDERGGCIITIAYLKSGLWTGTVRQVEEDIPIPWNVRISTGAPHRAGSIKGVPTGCGYSVVVTVDAPLGTPFRKVK
jgi:hypothetical protein